MSLGLVFLLVINNVIAAIPGVNSVFPYTPEGAMLAILYPGGNNGPEGVELLTMGGGVIVLMLWALIPASLGAAVTLNRDIT
jgi:hypothetical protein